MSGIGSIFLLTSSLVLATTSHPVAARSNSEQLAGLSTATVQPWLSAGKSGSWQLARLVQKKKVLGIFNQPTPTPKPSVTSSPGVTKTGVGSPSPTISPTASPAATSSPASTASPTPAATSSPGVTKTGVGTPVAKPVTKTVKKKSIRGMFGQPALKKPVTKTGPVASPTPTPSAEKKVLGVFSPATPKPQPAASPKTSGQKLLGIFNR